MRSRTSDYLRWGGTACRSRPTGTSPTTVIVAECSSSATSGTVERDFDQHAAVLVDDELRPPDVVGGERARAREARQVVVDRTDPQFIGLGAGKGVPHPGDLGPGEDHLRDCRVVRARPVRREWVSA